jgi:hypothetical protein
VILDIVSDRVADRFDVEPEIAACLTSNLGQLSVLAPEIVRSLLEERVPTPSPELARLIAACDPQQRTSQS